MYLDNLSFLWQYHEIFYKKYYDFEGSGNPVVFDCGANIGLATLFFLRKFPSCKIFSFEADPQVADIFRANIEDPKVHFVAKAVWKHNEGVRFEPLGSDIGQINKEGGVNVESVRLLDELKKHTRIDLLKMDIEGAEMDVLLDCAAELHRVKHIFFEYHQVPEKKSKLGQLLHVIEQAGFKIIIHNESVYEKHPLIRETSSNSFEFQLNIFCINEGLV